MCIHGEAGREHEEEHAQGGEHHRGKGKGSIFANAASVLSMAAEEISLDDHLEKELANEVELWRLDTSSTPVQKTALGLASEGKSGLSGISTIGNNSQFLVPFADQVTPRERSTSPTLRTQVSLHNRVGGGVASRPASGTVATSPAPARPGSSGGPDRAASSPPVKERHGSRPPLRERTFPGHGDVKAGAQSSTSGGEGDGAGGPPPLSQSSDVESAAASSSGVAVSAAAAAAAAAETASGGDAAAGEGTCAPLDAKPEAVPPASPDRAFIPQEKRSGAASHSHANASDGLSEGPPDPSADDREVDNFSSSEESTFAGFIEDPFEKERVSEEPWLHTPVKRNPAAANLNDWESGPETSDNHEARMLSGDQLNGRRRSTLSDMEEVRPDRSVFF